MNSIAQLGAHKGRPYNQRQSIRLKGYDYAQNNAYFITICNHNREFLFGDIIDQKMILNDAGKMIDLQWNKLQNRFNHIQLDEYIVMPNHFHGIIILNTFPMNTFPVGAPLVGAQCLADELNKKAPTRGAPTIDEIMGDTK